MEKGTDMAIVIAFIAGFVIGAFLALIVTCACVASGMASREEERMERFDEYAQRKSEE